MTHWGWSSCEHIRWGILEISKSSNPWHSWLRLKGELEWETFSLCCTQGGGRFPINFNTCHEFIFYNILSLKRDGVDSTRGGPLMRVVMLRRWELSVTLTMAKPYFFSFQLPTRAWSRSWKKSCFNHNLWQLWGKCKTSFTCNYPGLIDRMHKQASDSGLGRMRVAGDR